MRVITKKNNNPNQFVLTEERLINRELRFRLESFAEYSVVILFNNFILYSRKKSLKYIN